MLLAILILSILFSTAEAVIPLRLVEEIQLPARTRTWDVEHIEDSTSFGWAAITDGATVWGVDSLGDDSLIAIAVDTIWYQSRTEDSISTLLFERTEFSPWYNSLGWAGLNLFKFYGRNGLFVVARAIDGLGSTYDQYVYFFDLLNDSALYRTRISVSSDDSYSLKAIETWPSPPQSSNVIIVIRSRHYDVGGAGCDESTTTAASLAIRLPFYNTTPVPGLRVDIFDRSQPLTLAYFTGRSSWIYGCQDEESHWSNHFLIGTLSYVSSFQSTLVDTFDQWGNVLAQQDFDGTKRILYSNGDCYNAESGEVLFSNTAIGETGLSAYIRSAPGEDFLSFQSNRFDVYDGRTGEFVDSTTQIEGVPVKKFVGSGFDEILTFDNTTKIVRIYKPYSAVLTILATESGQVELTWTESPGAIAYQLDRAEDSEFVTYSSDFFSPNITSITLEPQSGVEFFRVTPLFE